MTHLPLLFLFFVGLSLLDAAANEAYPSDGLKPIRREVYDGGMIFDISHRYTPEMPEFESSEGLGQFLRLAASMKNGSIANNSQMKFSVHTGTHVDAPGHFFDHYYDAGFDADSLNLETLNGPALLVDVPRDKNITAEVMESLHIPKGTRRVLFRTLNTDRRLMFKKEFDSSFVGFLSDGARWLVENTDIKLVGNIGFSILSFLCSQTSGCSLSFEFTGVDYLSVAAFTDLAATHHVLLRGRDIIPVEALKLDGIEAGLYSLHCLPLRLVGAEASPVRCILIK
ncbi:PREDICTED: uncharacterized protein LOC104819562 isoform X1 [Tarenaya hassleriana]|uniref:uncharacterized protein LOC104819562 isoform X1 n=1 Tax=Tarenaya hassleriana TaxID=28532 RepID=UPI00053C0B06|nr:PREDICTED: uncharacterized protein LOC104819562 isoform X1 [Tarenaya hassleriana]